VTNRHPWFWAGVISGAVASALGAQATARGTIALPPLEVPPPYRSASVHLLDSLVTA